MEKPPPSNIFDFAKKKLSGPKKPLETKASEESPAPKTSPINSPINPITPQSNLQINEMIEQIFRMKEDLEKKLTHIYEKTGLSKGDVEHYIKHSKDFPAEKLERLQNKMKFFEEKIWDIVGKGSQKKHVDDQKKKIEKDRKGKTLGSRKNWLPMR